MALGRKQLALTLEATCITAKRAVAADHPMAWDQYGDVIVAIGCSDRAHGLGLTDRRGDLGIASRFSGRDLAQLAPYGFLESGSGDIDRELVAASGRWIASSAPSTSSRRPPPSSTIAAFGNRRLSDSILSSKVNRQMPLLVAAIII